MVKKADHFLSSPSVSIHFLSVISMGATVPRSRQFALATGSFILFILAVPTLGWSGAFNLEPGAAQAIMSFTTTHASDYLLNDGSISAANFHKRETNVHFEYGIIPQLTAILEPTYLSASSVGPNASKSRFNDPGTTTVGGRLALAWWGSSALSTEVSVHLPSKAMLLDSWLLGQSHPEPEVRLLYGTSGEFAGVGTYFDIQAGFREQYGLNASEWHLDITHATHIAPTITLLNQSFLTRSLGGRHGLQLNYEQRKVQSSVVYDIGAISLQLGLFRTASARNAYAENGSLVAVWIRF